MRLIVRLLASAVALAVAAGLVDGISVGPGTNQERVLTLLGVAIIFGLVNAVVRPVLRLLTLPLVVLTLGLFLLVLNALMLLLTVVKDPWRTILLVPTIYLGAFVWENLLMATVEAQAATRFILLGALLVVLMAVRPHGLVGRPRVEVA